jgi:acyloxyacyl hydrolase
MLLKSFFVLLACLAVLVCPVRASANGGTGCVACTALVALVEQRMQIMKVNANDAMTELCGFLPSVLSDVCDVLLVELVPAVAPLIDAGHNPDSVCNVLGLCKMETAVCRLFPRNETEKEFVRRTNGLKERVTVDMRAFNICSILPGVCAMENHEPFFDTDGDLFSTYSDLRGSYWRGKDCDDLSHTIFPGRNSSDAVEDANCNGIYGVDPVTQKTYEDLWCANSGAMGVAALGDSATAHFRIPESYLTSKTMSKTTFANIVRLLENEADWPMLSWSTGHVNASEFSPDIAGPMTSVYSKLVERNRCNHRDFQNVGVNGARVSDLINFDGFLSRNAADNVKPILLFYSMVGNDVCNGHHTFNTMTTPTEYHDRIMAALHRADTFLPAGSNIVLIPLVDGRILFDTMHDRIHPIGSLNNDVTYAHFYDYLNCLDISPCWGWMNSNETVRNTTFEIASALNAQLPIITNESKGLFKNFAVRDVGNIFNEALANYTGPMWQLIEPVDGFHPSQLGNSIIGDFLFNTMVKFGLVGSVNPNNADIVQKFGDQGGY